MPLAYVANDQYYSSAWHLHKISAPAAWDISEGGGILVAIADTGVNPNHPDLVGKVLPGINTVDNTSNTSDARGHGTAVAGTVGAYTNNGIGVASIAGKVKILPIRISNDPEGYAYFSDMAEAITYAADKGARVVNLSYGGGGDSASIRAAASYMRTKRGSVVFSAGNSGDNPMYTDNPEIVLVSATNSNDVRTSWSSYGDYVDIVAPGENIYTTSSTGGYGRYYGTSFSAPIVSGVLASMYSANPAMTSSQAEGVLFSTAKNIGDSLYYGAGRVNALEAVKQAKSFVYVDTTPPVVEILYPTDGQVVAGTITVRTTVVDDVALVRARLYVTRQNMGEEYYPPFNYVLDTTKFADGRNALGIVALDTSGNVTIEQIHVNIQNNDTVPPTLQVSPSNNTTVNNKPVKIEIVSYDNTGSPVQIQLYLGNTLLAAQTGNSLSYSWNPRKESSGSYTFTITATDHKGNEIKQYLTLVKR